MSRHDSYVPTGTDGGCDEIVAVIAPRPRDLGGFSVRRLLPSPRHRHVGPFVFFDEMGPASFGPEDQGISVRPHPHIGLATVTYLYEGAIDHRDSLGSHQLIRPGAINWMVAGKGIVHSERMPEGEDRPTKLHGIQVWVALPTEAEECEPLFEHFAADTLPELSLGGGVSARVLLGRAFGSESPTSTHSPLAYVDLTMAGSTHFTWAPEFEERALFVAKGTLRVGSSTIEVNQMAILRSGRHVELQAVGDSRVMLLAGAPHPEERFMEWNFVSSRKERIEEAKELWRSRGFDVVPGDEEEWIPLP